MQWFQIWKERSVCFAPKEELLVKSDVVNLGFVLNVIENPEEKLIDDKPIAKRSFEIKESENKEFYGDPFPRRYSFE